MAKRLTKRQIKEDKFQTNILKFSEWIEKHSKVVTTVAVGVLVVIVLGLLLVNQSRAGRSESYGLLSEGVLYMVAGQNDQALETFGRLRAEHHGTDAERWGSLQLGNLYFARGQFTDARDVYADVAGSPPGDPYAEAAALSGVAACDEQMGNFPAAAEEFERAASVKDAETAAPEYLMSAARNWRNAGDVERARAAYQRILDEFPDYDDLARVKMRLAALPS